MGFGIKADATVTFVGLKQGLFTGQGPEMAGSIYYGGLGVQKVGPSHGANGSMRPVKCLSSFSLLCCIVVLGPCLPGFRIAGYGKRHALFLQHGGLTAAATAAHFGPQGQIWPCMTGSRH